VNTSKFNLNSYINEKQFQPHSDLNNFNSIPYSTRSPPKFSTVNFKPVRQKTQEEISYNRSRAAREIELPPRVHSDSSAINALYNIICQEKELIEKMSSVSRKQSKIEQNDVIQKVRSRSNSRNNDSETIENGKGAVAGTQMVAGKSTKEERMGKYKEERRKQLGLIQVDSKLDSNKDSKVSGNSKR
jgi:hypothetical protein